eukprot:7304344-Alexandrium_andersonii.AAC.1
MRPSAPSSGTATARAGRTWRARARLACSTSSLRCFSAARPLPRAFGRWPSAAEAAWAAGKWASCRA